MLRSYLKRRVVNLQKMTCKMDKFPLWAILILYERSKRSQTYNNYFSGFKSLLAWLNPVDCSALNLYPNRYLTKLECSYELQELAVILNTSQSQLLDYYNDVIKSKGNL